MKGIIGNKSKGKAEVGIAGSYAKMIKNIIEHKTALSNEKIEVIESMGMGKPIQWLFLGDTKDVVGLEAGFKEVCMFYFNYLSKAHPLRLHFKFVDTVVFYVFIYPMGKLKDEEQNTK